MEELVSGETLLSLAVGVLSILACVGYGLLIVQTRRQTLRVAQLEEQLGVFVDASINVAKAVERRDPGELSAVEVNARMPTRRWLLNEAKQRLQDVYLLERSLVLWAYVEMRYSF